MIRKRLSKSVPGGNRPWLIESEDVSQPLEPVAAPLGVRTVAEGKAPLGAKRVTLSLAEMVRGSADAGWPQDGQNRASGEISAAHAPQRTGGSYALKGLRASGLGLRVSLGVHWREHGALNSSASRPAGGGPWNQPTCIDVERPT
jgi:hypothetical protein